MFGAIDVSLEVYPDGTAATGYRLGTPETNEPAKDLPNLYALDALDRSIDARPERLLSAKPSLLLRIWRALTGQG